jgi:hypothetical protein
VTCDHRRWGIRDCRKARHRRGTARDEAWPTVRLASEFGTDDPRRNRSASGYGTDDPRRESGAGRADFGAVRFKYLGVRRRYNGRVNPGVG